MDAGLCFDHLIRKDEEAVLRLLYPPGYIQAISSEQEEVLKQGRSPDIRMKQGFQQFTEDYNAAVEILKRDVTPLLVPGTRVEIRFHYILDSSYNTWGDFARLIWRVWKT